MRPSSAIALVALSLGCGKSLPPEFATAQHAATAAYARGDYAGAATHWARAERAAPNARERDEARYRRATSLERASAFAAADALYAELERGSSERAERAAFARAELELRRGRREQGLRLLRAAALRYPSSGLSPRAMLRVLDDVERRRGPAAALTQSIELAARMRGTELEETLCYLSAQRLERSGATERALAAYLELVRRFPYPYGDYWDDASLAAARIEERLGRARAAVAHLERMLDARETSHLSGSYERPAYARARFRIAELYRDRLDDPARAAREFERVWSDHPTTLLADDALFEAALIQRQRGELGGACRVAERLVAALPESRYARCASELCPRLPRREDCRPYVRRRIEAARGSTTEDHSSSSSR